MKNTTVAVNEKQVNELDENVIVSYEIPEKSVTILDSSDLYQEVLEQYQEDLEDKNDIDYDQVSMLHGDVMEWTLEELNLTLQSFIERYEKRYKTSVAKLVFLGKRYLHYGAIGGNGRVVGAIGGMNTVDRALDGADDFIIRVTKDNKLELTKIDHDGRNTMELVLMTESELDKAGYEDLRAFLHEKGKKPVKLDNKFLVSYGR